MGGLARHLRRQGLEVHTLNLTPNWGQCGLDELAAQISAHVERTFAPEQKFDLIGFSMGGLVSRYYLQRLGGLARVRRFVTLSTPHQGTWLAHLLANPGCRQMRPGSAFLEDLASDADRLQRVRFTSFWTPLDLIILPPRSSEVSGAHNVKMIVALHPLMVWAPRCHRAVAGALAE
jgi:triacylglycerol lipase